MAGHMKCDTEMSIEQAEREHKYQIEEDVRALEKAEEVKKDKARYDEAIAMMKEKRESLDKAIGGK